MKRLLTTLLLLVLAATASAQTLDDLKYSISGARFVSSGDVKTSPGLTKGETNIDQELTYIVNKGATITLSGDSKRKPADGKYKIWITTPIKYGFHTSGSTNKSYETQFVMDENSDHEVASISLKIDNKVVTVHVTFKVNHAEMAEETEAKTKPQENKTETKKNKTETKPTPEAKPQEKEPDAKTISDGIYVIRFTNNPDYVLTLKDGEAFNNNVIHLWKWRNDNSQKWKITNENGKIAIRSMVNTNCSLDVKNFNYGNNAEIILYGFHGGDNQLWIPERLENGSYVLKTAGNTDFCLDLYEGDAKNGGIIELYYAHKLWPEWWTLEKVSK